MCYPRRLRSDELDRGALRLLPIADPHPATRCSIVKASTEGSLQGGCPYYAEVLLHAIQSNDFSILVTGRKKMAKNIACDFRVLLCSAVALLMLTVSCRSDAAQLMFSNSTPAFISYNGTSPRVWVMTQSQSASNTPQLQVWYSDDEGNSWSVYGTLDCNGLNIDVSQGPPASMVVHSSGAIFFSEQAHGSPAKIWKVPPPASPGGALAAQLVTTLDPTASIRPWGWTEDANGNLFAAQYGWAGATHYQTNLSYILQVSDPNGAPVGGQTSFSSWQWPITAYPETDLAQWIAPNGVVSDRHVHNLRFSTVAGHSIFYINGGDSPRNIMSWNGNLTTPPSLFGRVNSGTSTCSTANYLLTGFTGMTFATDGIYTGDDFTSCPAGDPSVLPGRANSVRFYPWSGMTSAGVPSGGGDPTVTIYRLTNSYDTPIYDLHATADGLNLYFVNYDETHCDSASCTGSTLTPPIRMSALHALSRQAATAPTVSASQTAPASPWNHRVIDCFQSSYVNLMYIANDRYGLIPSGMKHVFAFSGTCATNLDGTPESTGCQPNQVWRVDTTTGTPPSYCPGT